MIVNQLTKQILCTAHGSGKKHDFHLFKTSLVRLKPEIVCLADKGYQGIQKLHRNSYTPKKKPNAHLSVLDKQLNRELANRRVVIEQVNRCLKIFKILSERYRNRRRRFSLRFNLIAGLYNYELNFTN